MEAGNILEPMPDGSNRFVWYFTRGWYSLLTIPLFLFLVLTLVTEIRDDLIRLMAFGAAVKLLSGSTLVVFAVIGFGWILAFLPSVLVFSFLATLPPAWASREFSSRAKLFVLVVMVIAYFAISYGSAWAMNQFVSWTAARYGGQ